MNTRTSGFTLIELMIALAIFAILVLLAGPLYADFMGNTQIRSAAENSLAGVRLAQTNAVQNNRPAKFVIDPTAAGGWAVYPYNDELASYALVAVQTYSWNEGAPKTSVTLLPPGATTVTFDGLGRVAANGYPLVPDGTASLTEVDVTNINVSVGSRRNLHVQISAVGGTTATKLCDPLVLAPDPRSCS
jgi:type IV fimbrial biogenesis protein FimT